MKITDIKSYPVWVGVRNLLVIKVETDAGIYGLGESGLSGRELAVTGALRHYREVLIGQDPMQRGHLWQRLYRSQYFEGGLEVRDNHPSADRRRSPAICPESADHPAVRKPGPQTQPGAGLAREFPAT